MTYADDIAFHPEMGTDPAVLYWTVAPVRQSTPVDSSRGDRLPDGLAGLLADGTLSRVRIQPGRISTRLSDGQQWSDAGPRVRQALHDDLESDTPWPEPSTPSTPASGSGVPSAEDVALADDVRALLAGPVGAFAAGHGGSITLVGVHDGVVDVELHGACHGCPAAEKTLHVQLESELRRHHPGIQQVRQVDSLGNPAASSGACDHTPGTATGRRTWLSLRRSIR